LSQCDALILLLNDSNLRTQIYQMNEFLRYSIGTSRRRPIIPIEFGSSNDAVLADTPLADFQKLLIDPVGKPVADQRKPILDRLARIGK
jgi:hypothetical protein